MGLDLVRDLSAKSWVSQRLWRTIKSLKDVAPRFGLNPDDDAHSNAALGMIGLARGHMDSSSVGQPSYSNGPSGPPVTPGHHAQSNDVDNNGARIQNELSRIFEGYVGLNGFQYNGGENHGQQPQSDMGSSEVFGGNGTVFPHLRELF